MEQNMPDETSEVDVQVRRTEDFLSFYANNVVADSTAWDLRLTFGQFDKISDGSGFNNQRLSVTLPFSLAKLMLYWVELQILAHEAETGKRIGIRANLLPEAPIPVPKELENDPNALRLHDAIAQLRARFIASLE
jgi:hypothetical protein